MSSAYLDSTIPPGYITNETTRASLSFAVDHSKVEIFPTIITSSFGSLKLLGIHSRLHFFSPMARQHHGKHGTFAIPAMLYLINNLLYLTGLEYT